MKLTTFYGFDNIIELINQGEIREQVTWKIIILSGNLRGVAQPG